MKRVIGLLIVLGLAFGPMSVKGVEGSAEIDKIIATSDAETNAKIKELFDSLGKLVAPICKAGGRAKECEEISAPIGSAVGLILLGLVSKKVWDKFISDYKDLNNQISNLESQISKLDASIKKASGDGRKILEASRAQKLKSLKEAKDKKEELVDDMADTAKVQAEAASSGAKGVGAGETVGAAADVVTGLASAGVEGRDFFKMFRSILPSAKADKFLKMVADANTLYTTDLEATGKFLKRVGLVGQDETDEDVEKYCIDNFKTLFKALSSELKNLVETGQVADALSAGGVEAQLREMFEVVDVVGKDSIKDLIDAMQPGAGAAPRQITKEQAKNLADALFNTAVVGAHADPKFVIDNLPKLMKIVTALRNLKTEAGDKAAGKMLGNAATDSATASGRSMLGKMYDAITNWRNKKPAATTEAGQAAAEEEKAEDLAEVVITGTASEGSGMPKSVETNLGGLVDPKLGGGVFVLGGGAGHSTVTTTHATPVEGGGAGHEGAGGDVIPELAA